MRGKIFLLVFLVIGPFSINNPAGAGNDWEYWSHYEVVDSISDNLDFKVKPEFRFNNNLSNHYYTHIDIGLDWKVNDWFILSPYYRHVNEKKENDWKVEYRPHLSATFKWKHFGLNFNDRNQLEYRIKEDKKFFRYGNKLTVNLPKFTRFNLQSYFSEEFFYDFDANELNKNRVYAGVNFKIIKNLTGDFYYIFESRKKTDDWLDVNVLGTALKYNF